MLPNRSGSTDYYRYGFQGQERDDEIKGEGNSINYTFRMHDPRVGRFFAVDPLTAKYPWYSPYQFSGNRVIDAVEIEGLEPWRLAKYLVKIIFGKVDKAVAVDKIENADIYDETNQYNSRVLGYLTYDIFTDTLQFTDIDDAVIIGTTILPGETGPINVKGETATKTDQYFAFGGVFAPVIAGAVGTKVWRLFKGDIKLGKGIVKVTEDAIEFAGDNKNKIADLNKLVETGKVLSDRGLDVIIKGEGALKGEITIMGAYGKQIPAESKKLVSNSKNAVVNGLRDGTKQAGTGGFTIIDGTTSGTTLETFNEGLESFIRNSVETRKAADDVGNSGTIIFLYGENGMDIIKF